MGWFRSNIIDTRFTSLLHSYLVHLLIVLGPQICGCINLEATKINAFILNSLKENLKTNHLTYNEVVWLIRMQAFFKHCVHAWILVVSKAGWAIGLIGKGDPIFFSITTHARGKVLCKLCKYTCPVFFGISGWKPKERWGKFIYLCYFVCCHQKQSLNIFLPFYLSGIWKMLSCISSPSSFSFYSWDLFSKSLATIVTLLWICSYVSISSLKCSSEFKTKGRGS